MPKKYVAKLTIVIFQNFLCFADISKCISPMKIVRHIFLLILRKNENNFTRLKKAFKNFPWITYTWVLFLINNIVRNTYLRKNLFV